MRANTDWFQQAGWGVFTHYLAAAETSAEAWQAQVDAFDVERLADQLAAAGAPYTFITIGQNSGHYCAPNATYDALVGRAPSRLARRDLVADLADALAPRGIRLLVYLPSGAPSMDEVAMERLEWRWGFAQPWPSHGGPETGERLAAFQERWEAVIREWSLRWGRRVWGWWFDGCYFADAMYRRPEPPNFASFAAAAKAGNPDALVAFNPGVKVPVICHSVYEDYTAGEISTAFPVCPGRWLDGAQYHLLGYLGQNWCRGGPRFPDAFVIGYTQHVREHGGVITWDVPITPEGRIPEAFVAQLARLAQDSSSSG
jgi:hypothetical protein